MITFPGCLFGATFTDLEISAKGEKRGFYVVDFKDKVLTYDLLKLKLQMLSLNK